MSISNVIVPTETRRRAGRTDFSSKLILLSLVKAIGERDQHQRIVPIGGGGPQPKAACATLFGGDRNPPIVFIAKATKSSSSLRDESLIPQHSL